MTSRPRRLQGGLFGLLRASLPPYLYRRGHVQSRERGLPTCSGNASSPLSLVLLLQSVCKSSPITKIKLQVIFKGKGGDLTIQRSCRLRERNFAMGRSIPMGDDDRGTVRLESVAAKRNPSLCFSLWPMENSNCPLSLPAEPNPSFFQAGLGQGCLCVCVCVLELGSNPPPSCPQSSRQPPLSSSSSCYASPAPCRSFFRTEKPGVSASSWPAPLSHCPQSGWRGSCWLCWSRCPDPRTRREAAPRPSWPSCGASSSSWGALPPNTRTPGKKPLLPPC